MTLTFKEFCERTNLNESEERKQQVHYVSTSSLYLTEDKPCFTIRREFYEDENENLEETTEPQKIELVNEFNGSNLLITKVEETRFNGKKTNADVLVDSLKGNVAIQTRFINHPTVKGKVSDFIREAFKNTTKAGSCGYWKAEDAIEIISAVADGYVTSTNDFFDKIFNDPKEIILEKMTQKFGKYHVQTKAFAGLLTPEQTRELTNGLPMVRLDEVEDKNYVRKNGEEDFVESKICEVLFYLEKKSKK